MAQEPKFDRQKECEEYLNKLTPFQEQWLAALESGDYAQCTSKLCLVITNDEGARQFSYCCLGVGSMLLGLEERVINEECGNTYVGFWDREKVERNEAIGNPKLHDDIFVYAGAPRDVRDRLHLRGEMGHLACPVIEIDRDARVGIGVDPRYIILAKPTSYQSQNVNVRTYTSLAEMNDQYWSFKQLAAFIRKYPWAVFDNFRLPTWAER